MPLTNEERDRLETWEHDTMDKVIEVTGEYILLNLVTKLVETPNSSKETH